MRVLQLFYGWQDGGEYKLSRASPDAPIRPVFASSQDRRELENYARKKRGKVMWWPPLKMDELTA